VLYVILDQRGHIGERRVKEALRTEVFERAKFGIDCRWYWMADCLLAFLDLVSGTLIRVETCEWHLEDAREAFCGWKRLPFAFFNLNSLAGRTYFVLTLCHTPIGFGCDHGVHGSRMWVECAN
jgi:hypothetical protein